MVLTYQDIESVIDPEQERDAIVKLLDTYWNVRVAAGKTMGQAIDYLLQEGIKVGIATQETITEEKVRRYQKRHACMLSDIGLKGIPETIVFTNTTKGSEYDFYKKPGQLEFEEKLTKQAEKKFRLRGIPKGYQRVLRNDWIPYESLPFEGTNLHFYPYSSDIAHSLTPETVVQRRTTRSQLPREILIDAVYEHGISIGMVVVDQKYSDLREWSPELKARLEK